ncbi:MAG: hypothetical protein RIT06_418 [Chloroflexota bacterium]|jgi:predicted GNAT family N-acyltransferase|nr:MAG: GNAT family N-acetyltransferase [Chloroflexota bacterium]
MNTLLIRRATLDEIIPLRHAVLRAGRPIETAYLPGDAEGLGEHWGAWSGGTLAACVSLYQVHRNGQPTTQLRGAATVEGLRNQGVGGALLDATLAAWRSNDQAARPLWCNARIRAVTFYERRGFIASGEPFDFPDAGTHRYMELAG